MNARLRWPFWRRHGALESPTREASPSHLDGGAITAVGSCVAPLPAREEAAQNGSSAAPSLSSSGVRVLPRPAIRWLGETGRVALRAFEFSTDADAICSFQKETYTLNFPDFRFTEGFSAAFRHDLRRAALDPHHALFVLDEGQVIGFLWLVICQNTWTNERYGYINNVYLAPFRRGQGLARALMEQSDAFFRSRGIHRARLTVTASNLPAAHLYQACGYEITRWEMEKPL